MLNNLKFFDSEQAKKFWLKLKHPGTLVRSFSIASSWNAAIILSQFILSPIVTRIYGPTEYGVYAIFSSIVLNISILGSLKYAETIVLQKTTEGKNNAVALSLLLISIISVFTLITVFFLSDLLRDLFKEPRLAYYFWLIPITIFLMGCFEIFLNINISDKRFFRNGLAGFANSAGARLMNIGFGLTLDLQSIGLIFGDIFGKVISIVVIIFSFERVKQRLSRFFKQITFLKMWQLAGEYKSFPLYFLPSTLLVVFSNNLPIFFFQWKFGAIMVGSFGLASSMLEIVNRLIPYSFAPVFLQKANELKMVSPQFLAQKVYLLFLGMLVISTIIFSGFALLGDFIFPFVFGGAWKIAGEFSAILSLTYVFNFVAISLSEVYNVMSEQRYLFIITMIGVFLRIVSMVVILMVGFSPSLSLLIYSAVSSIGGILQIVGVFLILQHPTGKVFGFLVLSFFTVAFFLLLGYLL